VPVPRAYLIGGAPRTGKSTLAGLLGKQLSLTPIATDDLRTQVRAATPPSAAPDLYYLDSLNADQANMTRLMLEHTAGIIAAADRESALVWPAVEQLIREHFAAGRSVLIEGVAILPALVAGLNVPYSIVHLGNQSDAHTKIILENARQHPDTWLGSLPEATIRAFAKYTQAYSDHAQTQAQNNHQTYLEMSLSPFNKSLQKAIKTL
jgi:2-phosphoglycerate kinase